MSLEGILKKAVQDIRAGKLKKEAQVRQVAIVPILRAMDWDDTNLDECESEFSVGKGCVDYALLRPEGGDPLVFVEAKAPGRATAAGEEQVFGYAENKGVPFLILTDGDCWDFYLSMAEGPPADRRFYRAELTREERIPEYVEFFEEHLRKHRVVSGDAQQAAKQRLKSDRERQRARAAIPGAWLTLLEKPEKPLVELLVEQLEDEVKKRCGTKPESGDVEAFVMRLRSDPPPQSGSPDPGPETKGGKNSKPMKLTGFVLHGNSVETRTVRNTLVEILKAFQRADPGFLERLAPLTEGRARRLVARKREDLYANDRERCFKESASLGDGWWVMTSVGTDFVRRRIRIACEVAGVKFGSELRLIER